MTAFALALFASAMLGAQTPSSLAVPGRSNTNASIAADGDTVVVATLDIFVSWVSKRDGTTIRVARSADGGRTFTASRAVSTPAAPGNRGWHAMTIDAHGDLDVVWLDHREMASQPPHQMSAAAHGTHDARRWRRIRAFIWRASPAPAFSPSGE
jgi:hypothetical protein